jgi:hypothetical protein
MDYCKFYDLQDHYGKRADGLDSSSYQGWTYLVGDKKRVNVGHTLASPTCRLKKIFGSICRIPDKIEMHSFDAGKFGLRCSLLEAQIGHAMWEYQDWNCWDTKLFGNYRMSSGATEVYLVPFKQAIIIAYRVLNKYRKDKMQEQLELPFEESV